ncbi:ZIP family metal transporter [Zoogloea dura]|nr:ZIP family metal transporter [Zoogloea dura]
MFSTLSPFTLSMLASLAGGLLSVLAAASLAVAAGPRAVPRLLSYAVGALLGAAFLELLPHAVEASGDAELTCALILGGVLLFFLLEKLLLWRFGHGHAHHGHGDGGRSGMLVMLGDTFHNFVDGVLIATAFSQDLSLGLITAAAIIAHEIPQELGDFAVLIHSGLSRGRALVFNLFSSLAMGAGALLAHWALPAVDGAVPVLLALACASMLYVAAADLMPGLRQRTHLAATAEQVVLIGAGVVSIGVAHHLAEHVLM